MKKKLKLKTMLLVVAMLSMFSVTAFATSYGSSATMLVAAKGGWQSDHSIKDTKAYENVTTGKINVTNETMWTTPKGRIVNSNDDARSSSVDLSGAGTFSVSLYSSCKKGYTYYLSVKPSAYQTGTDSITARINVG